MQQEGSDDLGDEQDLGDVILALEQHCSKCEREGNYVEAELVKQKLDDLRRREEARRKALLKARQQNEQASLEEANLAMYQHFNSMWDNEIYQFEEQARELEESMKERHQLEFREFQQALANEPRHHPKFSRDLLNLRKIQETLATQKQYTEAHKIKIKADAMEEWELQKLEAADQGRNENRLRQFQMQQQHELQALKKRLSREREEIQNQRAADAERLLRRFRNVERELNLQQRFEKLRMDRQKLSPTRIAKEGESTVQSIMLERHMMSPRTSLNAENWAAARRAGATPRGSPPHISPNTSPALRPPHPRVQQPQADMSMRTPGALPMPSGPSPRPMQAASTAAPAAASASS
ncbi:putative transmembrane protein [Paratrimastix pyriformis]|uniref:Transmembrane protein n=1 Tax=Paratrimastix pyriformis TaxID=342808 RepID=A0ABQ8UPB5_9EUKA|nr:putative transmembrane protein [Paratrimastix pyriformis]